MAGPAQVNGSSLRQSLHTMVKQHRFWAQACTGKHASGAHGYDAETSFCSWGPGRSCSSCDGEKADWEGAHALAVQHELQSVCTYMLYKIAQPQLPP